MPLSTQTVSTLLAVAILGTGCPEDVPADGTQGGANGNPAAAGAGAGVTSNAGPGGGGAHDCSTPRLTQEAITDGVPLEGVVSCESCSGSVTIKVLDLPPDKGGSSDQDPCITTATLDGPGVFSIQLPSTVSAVNIQTVDDNDLTSWGLLENVTLTESGAQGVDLVVGDKPVGTPKTSAGEDLPSEMSGVDVGSPPDEVGAEAPGVAVEGQPGSEGTETVAEPATEEQ